MLVVYKKDSGKIIRYLPENQDPLVFYHHYDDEFKNNLGWIVINEGDISEYKNCYVKNGNIIKHTDEELKEKLRYGKILTEEEKLNIALSPSHEEIAKAKAMLEILPLLEEVRI